MHEKKNNTNLNLPKKVLKIVILLSCFQRLLAIYVLSNISNMKPYESFANVTVLFKIQSWFVIRKLLVARNFVWITNRPDSESYFLTCINIVLNLNVILFFLSLGIKVVDYSSNIKLNHLNSFYYLNTIFKQNQMHQNKSNFKALSKGSI